MAGRKKLSGPVNYFELPRKQLQSLCKKYGYPANKTNQLMAEFLTSHLNSDEYLNRDKSQPSPAVKTKFQCRDEEIGRNQPTTDDNLPTISESQSVDVKINARRLSHEFMNADTADTERPVEASKAAGTGPGQANLITSEDVVAAGIPVGEPMDLTTSSFKIRDACLQYERESGQDTALPPSTPEEAINITNGCDTEGASRLTLTGSGSGDLSTSEEVINSVTSDFESHDSSMESQRRQETPLPLSVMPYVRPATPDDCPLRENGVKLFVDLKSDGLPPGENLMDYYRAWGASRTSDVTKMQDEGVTGSLIAVEGSERNPPVLESHITNVLSRANRTAEDEVRTNDLLSQASVVSTSAKKVDAAPLKSCLVTPNRKPSSLNVSFFCPPIFSSPRSISGLVLDPERSEIVKEWSVDGKPETIQPIDVIACSDEYKAVNGELVLRNLDQNLPEKESSVLNSRTLQSTADMESPPVGIVENAVKTFEEQSSQSRGPPSIDRMDSYKASPFLKSSRIAAELERASKLGQTRRIGILALKRAMGVEPLFSDTQDVEMVQPQDGARSSPAQGTVVSKANTSSNPIQSQDNMVIQLEGISATGGVSSSDMDTVTQTEPLVATDTSQNEVTTLSTTEDVAEKDEQMKVETDTSSDNVKGNEAPVEGDEAANLPASVEESVTSLSWMTKPIQIPARRPVHQKFKEKPARPFSANGRTLELMERASAKLKMLKKSTSVRVEVVSKPKTSSISADPKGLEFRGCAEVVEPAGDVTMAEEATENPVARFDNDTDSISTKHTSSQSEKVESTDSCQANEGHLSAVEDEKFKESACDALINSGLGETDEELNVQRRLDTTENTSTERQSASVDTSKAEEKVSEKPSVALSFLDIDFTKMKVLNAVGIPPPRIELEIDYTKLKEKIAADKSTPLSPLDSNRFAIDAVVDSTPNPITPTKPFGILDVISESEEKRNANGLSSLGKENEWSRRQEQHKSPLTGRSKEKALRTAEKKGSNLREQLLKKRRGMMMEEQIAGSDSLVQSIDSSPLTQLATNRLL